MGTVILDSSILLALFDPEDFHHDEAVANVRVLRKNEMSFSVPATVVAEVLVGAARQGIDQAKARLNQIELAFGEAEPITSEIAVEAARLRAQYRWLRLPDALVIATGHVANAHRILTADHRWEKVGKKIIVINKKATRTNAS